MVTEGTVIGTRMPATSCGGERDPVQHRHDPVGIELLKHLGEDNVMWGSDFPHPDGIWPDSQEFLGAELNEVSPEAKRKIVRDNAMKLYRLAN